MKLKEIEPYVIKVLEKCKEARENDFYLYGLVLMDLGIDLKSTSLGYFLFHQDKMNVPNFKSVERCRRHIQELRTDLCSPKVAVKRQELEEEYKDYNRSCL